MLEPVIIMGMVSKNRVLIPPPPTAPAGLPGCFIWHPADVSHSGLQAPGVHQILMGHQTGKCLIINRETPKLSIHFPVFHHIDPQPDGSS